MTINSLVWFAIAMLVTYRHGPMWESWRVFVLLLVMSVAFHALPTEGFYQAGVWVRSLFIRGGK